MLHFFAIPAIVLALSSTHADPVDPVAACNHPESVQACAAPYALWSLTPDGQQIHTMAMRGRDDGITEPQIASVCRITQTVTTCLAGYLSRCVPQNITDVHTLSSGIVKLTAQLCNRTDNIVAKIKMIVECSDQLANCTARGRDCRNAGICSQKGIDRLSYLYAVTGPTEIMDLFRSGRLLKDVCCAITEMSTCIAPEMSTCTSQTSDLTDQMVKAILGAFGCAEKTAGGCPEVPVSARQGGGIVDK